MNPSSTRTPLPVINLLEDPAVVRLTRHEAQRYFYPLVHLLVNKRSRIARILSGKDAKPWSEDEMRQVEKIVLREVRDDRYVVGFLRVLRRLCECWVLRQDCEAPLPRTAVLLPDLWNPHSRNLARALQLYRDWGMWLTATMTRYSINEEVSIASAPIDSVVPVIASAVLYGGLWNSASLVALVRAIPDLLSYTLASRSILYVGISLSQRACAAPEFRSWQPDPLTATILMSTSETAVTGLLQSDPTNASGTIPDDLIFQRLVTEFNQFAQRQSQEARIPTGLASLLRVAESVGYTQVPALLAAYAGRRLVSHSLSLEQLQRISDEVWVYQPPVAGPRTTQVAEASSDPEIAQQIQWPSWIDFLDKALDTGSASTMRNQLRAVVTDGIPLASRMTDFAARAILLRTLGSPRRSLESFRERILLLAREAYVTWEDTDPAALASPALEASLKMTVERFDQSRPSEARRRRLRSVLREFHRYLQDCCSAPALKDRAILASIPPGDQPDVDLLTFTEFREVLRRIEIQWPGRKNWSVRQIAKILMILGFRCGLRREEARLLKVRDLLLNEIQEILVRPSADHTLKSPSARRRLPVGLLAEPDELEVLNRFWSYRVNDQQARPNDILLVSAAGGSRPASIRILQKLNKIIADVTATAGTEQPAHFHHGRASVASWGLMRLLLPEDVKIPRILASVEAEWLRSGATFQPEQIRRMAQPSRSDAFLIGSLLGHQHPRTTMERYFHFGSEILRVYLDRSPIMRPAPELVEKVCGITPGMLGNQGTDQPLLRVALSKLTKRAESDQKQRPRVSRIESSKQNRRGIPAWLRRSQDILSIVDTTNGSMEEAARIVQMDISDAILIANRATYLAALRSANGEPRHRFEQAHTIAQDAGAPPRSVVPLRPRLGHHLQWISEYANRLEQLYSDPRSRSLVQRGWSAYVHATWLRQNCAVFHNPFDDGGTARCYVDLLQELGIQLQNVRFASFDTSQRSPWRSRWRDALGFSSRIKFEQMRTPFGETGSSKSWIAIEPRFDGGAGGGNCAEDYGFRYLLVMAYITFGE